MSVYFQKVGDALRLNAFLDGGETDKFIRVHVYKADGSEIAGSPVTLTNVVGGFYKNHSAFTMPNDPQLNALYQVYDDAGFTVKNDVYPDSADQFCLNAPDQGLNELVGVIDPTDNGDLAQDPFLIIRGEDRTLRCRLQKSDGTAFDLSGVTEIEVKFKTGSGSISKKYSLANVLIVGNPINGIMDVMLTDTDTALLAVVDRGDFTAYVDFGSVRRIANFIKVLTVKQPLV